MSVNFSSANYASQATTTNSISQEENKTSNILLDKKDKIKKPEFGDSFISGLGHAALSAIPVVGTYYLGREHQEQENILSDIEKLKNGEETSENKISFVKSMVSGLCTKAALATPIIGTYFIGKEHLKQENAIKELNGEETQKINFFSAWKSGFAQKYSSVIPILGSYVRGKEYIQQDKLKEAVDDLKDTQTTASNDSQMREIAVA